MPNLAIKRFYARWRFPLGPRGQKVANQKPPSAFFNGHRVLFARGYWPNESHFSVIFCPCFCLFLGHNLGSKIPKFDTALDWKKDQNFLSSRVHLGWVLGSNVRCTTNKAMDPFWVLALLFFLAGFDQSSQQSWLIPLQTPHICGVCYSISWVVLTRNKPSKACFLFHSTKPKALFYWLYKAEGFVFLVFYFVHFFTFSLKSEIREYCQKRPKKAHFGPI